MQEDLKIHTLLSPIDSFREVIVLWHHGTPVGLNTLALRLSNLLPLCGGENSLFRYTPEMPQESPWPEPDGFDILLGGALQFARPSFPIGSSLKWPGTNY